MQKKIILNYEPVGKKKKKKKKKTLVQKTAPG